MAYITRHGNNAPTIFDIFNRPLSDFDFSGNNQAPERESGFAVDVRDLGNCYVLEADLPGCTKGDINLQFEDGVLTISANHHARDEGTEEQNEGTYIIRERQAGIYRRSFRFQDADAEQINASFEDGKLCVMLKKQQSQKGRRITIA